MRQASLNPAGASHQFNPESFLGRALKDLHKRDGKKKRVRKAGDPPSNSSSSSSSSSSSEESSSESSSSGYDSDWSTDSSSAGRHNRGKRRGKHKKSGIHLQKPIDPKTYSGTDDVSVFHRFMQDSYTYVDILGNKRRCNVYHISQFLDGTARDFYNIVVSSEYQKWDLARFFRELINYCFPRDFKTRLRRKIDGCYQGGHCVRVYAHKLCGMYHMLGDESERVQVIRLWRGMSKDITYQLLLQGFSEEVHTWDEL
ncbi:hypothetical protein CPB85DRAFT_1224435, partial [Mucidula mucida]